MIREPGEPRVEELSLEQQREKLEGEFFDAQYVESKEGDGKRVPVSDILRKDKKYKNNVEGTNILDDPLCQIDAYTFECIKAIDGQDPAKKQKAEDAIRELLKIREEVGKEKIDAEEIDKILSDFLYERLRHFFDTKDQRVSKQREIVNERLAKLWEEHPEKKPTYELETISPRINQLEREVGRTMSGVSKFKARNLVKLAVEVQEVAFRVMGDKDAHPFTPDDYNEGVTAQA